MSLQFQNYGAAYGNGVGQRIARDRTQSIKDVGSALSDLFNQQERQKTLNNAKQSKIDKIKSEIEQIQQQINDKKYRRTELLSKQFVPVKEPVQVENYSMMTAYNDNNNNNNNEFNGVSI
jgi:hypothetical protein